ncbi:hypothetical protein J7E62_10785 [Variovorax paradoxus]|nr:hypothetical protein [Variovorax paradoxus]
MQAKQILGISAFLLAGAVSAQTVPAEAWVGAPIATTGTMSRGEVTAELQRSMATPRTPSEQWVGTPATASIAVGAMSRAEVLADLSLFNKAGLRDYARYDSPDAAGPGYARRLAAYRQARDSDAFVAEVQRIEGMRGRAMASTRAASPAAE